MARKSPEKETSVATRIKEAEDKVLDRMRATGNAGMVCMICGKEIRKNQAFRALPKDRNCRDERLYHLRTCGPGSERWKAFKANGNKPPEESVSGNQLSFKWNGPKG